VTPCERTDGYRYIDNCTPRGPAQAGEGDSAGRGALRRRFGRRHAARRDAITATSAVFGNDVATFPDYPAEIRAPIGTLAGVSGFQINFSSREIHTPGDRVDALVAMNPAALKVNVGDLVAGGVLVSIPTSSPTRPSRRPSTRPTRSRPAN